MSDENEDIENDSTSEESIGENATSEDISQEIKGKTPSQFASSSRNKYTHEESEAALPEMNISYRPLKGNSSTVVNNELAEQTQGLLSQKSLARLQKIENDEFLMKLVAYDELPEWQKDNEYLRQGYRYQMQSVSACFKTICSRHTETGNIWTHLIAFITFSIFMGSFAYKNFGKVPFLDYIVILFFFGSAIMCFGLSTLYHTLSCHSEPFIMAFAQLDYFGINLLITGSHVPWLYFAFYCHKRFRNMYLALLLLASVLITLCSLYEKFGEVNNRWIRSTLFGSFALSGVFPICHMLYLEGWTTGYNQGCLGWIGVMVLSYVVGGMLYTSRFPERICPGAFDIFFNSHQLMHVMTSLGTYVHMHAVYEMLYYRQAVGDCVYS